MPALLEPEQTEEERLLEEQKQSLMDALLGTRLRTLDSPPSNNRLYRSPSPGWGASPSPPRIYPGGNDAERSLAQESSAAAMEPGQDAAIRRTVKKFVDQQRNKQRIINGASPDVVPEPEVSKVEPQTPAAIPLAERMSGVAEAPVRGQTPLQQAADDVRPKSLLESFLDREGQRKGNSDTKARLANEKRASIKQIAANPTLLPMTDPVRTTLEDIGGIVPLSPTDKQLKTKQKAQAESQFQRELNHAEAEGDRFADARTQSQQVARRGQDQRLREPNSGDKLADATVNEAAGNMKRIPGGVPRRSVAERMMNDRFLSEARKAADDDLNPEQERIARRRHLQGIEQMASMPEATFGKYAYTPSGPSRLPGGKMPGGSRVIRDESGQGRISMEGPAAFGTDEEKAYLAKVSKQAGLSEPATSLSGFKEQQRLVAKQSETRGKQSSNRNLASLLAGQIGQPLSKEDAGDPAVLRAYNAGLKKGPTIAQAMTLQRNEAERRQKEAKRDENLRLLATLTAARDTARTSGKPTTELDAGIARLARELGEPIPGGGVAQLPRVGVQGRVLADQFMGRTKEGQAKQQVAKALAAQEAANAPARTTREQPQFSARMK